MWDFVNKSKYRMCTNSVQKANGNSIKFSLSTQTRRVVKSSQTKSLHFSLPIVFGYIVLFSIYITCPIPSFSSINIHYIEVSS